MRRWPVVGFLGRAIVWIMAAFASLFASLAIAVAIAVPAAIVSKSLDKELYAMTVAVVVVSTIWPGLLTAFLIALDRGMYFGPSRQLCFQSLLWGAIPSALICAAWLLGWGPFSFRDVRLDQDGERNTKSAFWFYITPSIAAAIIGGACFRPKKNGE